VTLGSLARDQFFAVILDPADPHYGWIDKTRIWPQPADGAVGPTGPIYWHGAWDVAHPYVAGDGVSYEGSSYICIQAHTGQVPSALTRWSLVAAKGDAGTPGQAWPIGSVFIAVVSTDPATLLGYGTWSAIGAGRVLVGINPADLDFDQAEETGGSKTHTTPAAGAGTPAGTINDHAYGTGALAPGAVNYLKAGVIPTGQHTFTGTAMTTHPHDAASNLMPYLVVYMWKRTA
jgi:hypothetical protein